MTHALIGEPLAYLNGEFLPASQARLSVVDAGFVLGAAVAEQVRTFRGDLFRLEGHLDRLARSLELAAIDPGTSPGELAEIGRELVARNHRLLDPGDDLGLSLFVTPGLYGSYAPPGPPRATVCLHTYPLPFRLWAAKYHEGQALTVSDVRQVPADCWSPELKCRSRIHYYLADQRAARDDPGARAVLLDHGGRVTETSTANVLAFRRDEGLLSVPHPRVLHGISMAVLEELARGLGLRVSQRDLLPEDLAAADEVLVTSTPFCLLPVTRIDRQPVADGRPGPIFGQLLAAWSDLVGVDIAGQARQFAQRP